MILEYRGTKLHWKSLSQLCMLLSVIRLLRYLVDEDSGIFISSSLGQVNLIGGMFCQVFNLKYLYESEHLRKRRYTVSMFYLRAHCKSKPGLPPVIPHADSLPPSLGSAPFRHQILQTDERDGSRTGPREELPLNRLQFDAWTNSLLQTREVVRSPLAFTLRFPNNHPRSTRPVSRGRR